MTTDVQQAEVDKYGPIYKVDPGYAMGQDRRTQSRALMAGQPAGATFLDVGCGRGESLAMAEAMGYADWLGIESCPDLLNDRVVHGLAWAVPFPSMSWHTVACFDVLEHLLPGDEARCIVELGRVAQQRVLVTIGLYPAVRAGVVLHVNLRDPDEWTMILAYCLPDFKVTRRADLDCRGINGAWSAVRL